MVFSKRSDNRGVNLEVSSSETGPLMAVLVEGRVDELLKTAGELVSPDLAGLEPGKPVWIAFGGLEQVRLEVFPPAPTNAVAGVQEVAIKSLELARLHLDVVKRQAEVGVVAPQGPEMLSAELSVALAKAIVSGDALEGRRAKLTYTQGLLGITNAMFQAGKATAEDVESARLEVLKARAALQVLTEPVPRP